MTAKHIKPVGRPMNAWVDSMKPQEDNRKPEGQIIYRVLATDNDGNPIPIYHKNVRDKDGVLYIGETEIARGKCGQSRYRLIVRSFANPNRKTKHDAAKKYFENKLQAKYPLCGIKTQYKMVAKAKNTKPDWSTAPDGKEMATTGETSDLSSYEARFGSLPPLNDVRGRRLKGDRPRARSPRSSGKHVNMQRDPYSALRRAKDNRRQ